MDKRFTTGKWHDFRAAIEENIKSKSLTHDQYIYFAWLCAVRALPCLGSMTNFSYWNEKSKEKHLLSIFSAIDIISAYDLFDEESFADYTDYITSETVKYANVNASFASVSATINAVIFAIDATNNTKLDSVINAAVDAATAANAAMGYNLDFVNIILSDIENIKSNERKRLNNDTTIYGVKWHVFLDSLNEINCGYWIQLYEDLFNNKFAFDLDELYRRLNAPDEVRSKGAAILGQYIEELVDVVRLNEARIIILGEKGAGKTSLARRLINIGEEMPKEDESTEGVDVLTWLISDGQPNLDMYVHIWDFAGHTITHAAHRCFMSSRALYIYVYNGRVEHDNRPEYWLEQVKIYGKNSPIIFLVNERDGHKPLIERRRLKDEYPSIVGYFDVDIGADNNEKLKNFKKTIINMVRNNPTWSRQEMRADAYRIKMRLRDLFVNNRTDFINHDTFNAIAKEEGARPKNYDQILSHLNILGICLWYNTPEMKSFNHLVLNPDWITYGIYRIINWGYANVKQTLSIDYNELIFTEDGDDVRYQKQDVRFLFNLMREFELAFFKNGNEDRVFVPLLLPPDRPDELPNFQVGDCLTMVYEVKRALPPNITSRVIVRRHDEINSEYELWRKGAVLHYRDGNATALVVESDRTITVKIKGGDKTYYLAELRETMKEIFDSYSEVDTTLLYDVILPEVLLRHESSNYTKDTFEPYMVSEKSIVAHHEKAHQLLNSKTGQFVETQPTIEAYYLSILVKRLEDVEKHLADGTKSGFRWSLAAVIVAILGIVVAIVLGAIQFFL
jgi:hypothetical protein